MYTLTAKLLRTVSLRIELTLQNACIHLYVDGLRNKNNSSELRK